MISGGPKNSPNQSQDKKELGKSQMGCPWFESGLLYSWSRKLNGLDSENGIQLGIESGLSTTVHNIKWALPKHDP